VSGLLVAVRHAEVVEPARGRWLGAGSDPDADPRALRALRPRLRELAGRHPPTRILASPARRARQTAALLGRPVEVDRRLAERHFGDWEGRSVDECLASVDPRWLSSPERYVDLPVPGAEPAGAVISRVAALWRERAPSAEERLWVVAHGGSLRALVAVARAWTLGEAFRLSIPPGGWLAIGAQEDDGPGML